MGPAGKYRPIYSTPFKNNNILGAYIMKLEFCMEGI